MLLASVCSKDKCAQCSGMCCVEKCAWMSGWMSGVRFQYEEHQEHCSYRPWDLWSLHYSMAIQNLGLCRWESLLELYQKE